MSTAVIHQGTQYLATSFLIAGEINVFTCTLIKYIHFIHTYLCLIVLRNYYH